YRDALQTVFFGIVPRDHGRCAGNVFARVRGPRRRHPDLGFLVAVAARRFEGGVGGLLLFFGIELAGDGRGQLIGQRFDRNVIENSTRTAGGAACKRSENAASNARPGASRLAFGATVRRVTTGCCCAHARAENSAELSLGGGTHGGKRQTGSCETRHAQAALEHSSSPRTEARGSGFSGDSRPRQRSKITPSRAQRQSRSRDAPDYRPDQSGTFSRSSSSHTFATASLGARQSPRGESAPAVETFGPLGIALRLNWLNPKNRSRKLSSQRLIVARSYSFLFSSGKLAGHDPRPLSRHACQARKAT